MFLTGLNNMSKNPPAFPADFKEKTEEDYKITHFMGMTLRDYFAGKAMQGVVADSKGMMALYEIAKENGNHLTIAVAECAYAYAEAMLKEREKHE